MTDRCCARLVVILSLLAVVMAAAPRGIAAADHRAKYHAILKGQGPSRVVPPILAAFAAPSAAEEIEQLGGLLAESSGNAGTVLDALNAEKSAEAASVAAELLYAITSRVGGRRLSDDPQWRRVVEKGAALLRHDDPFVRGIATWALIVVRDANPGPRSEAGVPEAVAKCLSLKPEDCVECDFVLQAFALGVHRTSRDLARSAHEIVKRAEALSAHVAAHGDGPRLPEQRQRMSVALKTLKEAYERSAPGLAAHRNWWMQVRRAARKVVLAGPDLEFKELVFFKVPPRTEGNHPDCLVQNHDRPKERPPGGDIFVQSGTRPDAPLRPLVAGKLGPGHVQDMDLWWDADRLVFAFVRQPRWGDRRSNWGSVTWRNGPSVTVVDHPVGFKDGMFWENGSEPTHLFEIRLDGAGLRQLTNDPLYCDREPAYLPDGDVVFSSDRSCGASQCGAAPLAYSDFGLPNLYRVSADGGRVERLTYNKDVDRYPHCLDNGLIGYMRWDYQDRFWSWPHALWTIRPDGTMNDGLFKVHFNDPQSVREPRSVPGSQKLVVIACGHHAPPEGAVGVVDPSFGVNNPQGMRYVTPLCSPLEGGLGSSPTVAEGGVRDRGGFYRTPWPLSEKGFLVSYAHHYPRNTSYAAYYIDVWGNKELIRRDATMDVLCPMPLRKRVKPPVLPSQSGPESSYAVCYLDDVNRDMPGIPPGTVRYLRISEQLQWFFGKGDNTGPIRWTPGTQHMRNFGYWSWSPTRVIGTVPVEKDGSAYFKVPTGMPVTFQALDENLMEIRRMRSHVEFKPGEVRGCVGCHETKQHVPRMGASGGRLAFRREPSQPKPPPWGDMAIVDYEKMVQPVFERHCVGCHDANDKKGLDLTASRDAHGFMQSYRSLFGLKKNVPTPLGEGFPEAYAELPQMQKAEDALYESIKRTIYSPGALLCLSNHMSGPEVTQPKQFGSHRSRLILSLLADDVHRNDIALSSHFPRSSPIAASSRSAPPLSRPGRGAGGEGTSTPKQPMTRDEWEALVTWVDANAPYYSTFYQYFDSNGKLLAKPLRVRVDLDPPFKAGEKSYRIVAERTSPAGDRAGLVRASLP